MQSQLITGYTKEQMVLHFFENHQKGEFSSYFITNYIYNTFELPEEKTIEQLAREVCATLANFIYGKSTQKPNMNRRGIRYFFLYHYSGISNTNLPKETYVTKTKKKRKLKIQPTQQSFIEETKEEQTIQTSFDFDNIETNTQEMETIETMEEQNIPPLIEDIKNADYINQTIEDPLQYLMDQIEKMNLPNLNQIILKSKINNREITITIS